MHKINIRYIHTHNIKNNAKNTNYFTNFFTNGWYGKWLLINEKVILMVGLNENQWEVGHINIM